MAVLELRCSTGKEKNRVFVGNLWFVVIKANLPKAVSCRETSNQSDLSSNETCKWLRQLSFLLSYFFFVPRSLKNVKKRL